MFKDYFISVRKLDGLWFINENLLTVPVEINIFYTCRFFRFQVRLEAIILKLMRIIKWWLSENFSYQLNICYEKNIGK